MLTKLWSALVTWAIGLAVRYSVPTSPPPATPGLNPVAAEILRYNNGLAIFAGGASVYTNAAKGATIHKIEAPQAALVGSTIESQCSDHPSMPLGYTMGCLAIESAFDPLACNDNLAGSNTQNDPLGYDEGVAQFKLRFVPDSYGITVAEKLAFALDPSRAIPFFIEKMEGELAWAQGQIASGLPSQVDPAFSNAYYLATAVYQAGETGVMAIIESGQRSTHADEVVDLERAFCKALGLNTIFPL